RRAARRVALRCRGARRHGRARSRGARRRGPGRQRAPRLRRTQRGGRTAAGAPARPPRPRAPRRPRRGPARGFAVTRAGTPTASAPATLVRGAEVEGERVDVRIAGDRIAAIAPALTRRGDEAVLDAHGGALLPGLHDHHLHLFALAAALASTP